MVGRWGSPDFQARGRLLLFEVDYAYLAKEDGRHEHAVKLRQVFAKEQLGPVAGEVGWRKGLGCACGLGRGVGFPSRIITYK